jgi:hypothetical protein
MGEAAERPSSLSGANNMKSPHIPTLPTHDGSAGSVQRIVRRQVADHPYMSPLEKAAVEQALNAGEQFGYGNVMAWLATEWAVCLRDKWNLPDFVAVDAVSHRGPYQLPPNITLLESHEKKPQS